MERITKPGPQETRKPPEKKTAKATPSETVPCRQMKETLPLAGPDSGGTGGGDYEQRGGRSKMAATLPARPTRSEKAN